jgi:hypothetical protein
MANVRAPKGHRRLLPALPRHHTRSKTVQSTYLCRRYAEPKPLVDWGKSDGFCYYLLCNWR